jgi:hypothetical protein
MTDIPDAPDGDFLTVLSSELIAEVMEDYFNKKMYRQKVKVVDLQPQGSGYAFSLAFVKDTVHTYRLEIDSNNNGAFVPTHTYEALTQSSNVDYTVPTIATKRDPKGKFTRKDKVT